MKKLTYLLLSASLLITVPAYAETSAEIQIKIDVESAQLEAKSTEISELLTEISDTTADIQKTTDQITVYENQLANQARTFQTNNYSLTVFDILVGSDTIYEKINQLLSMTTILSSTNKSLKDLETLKSELEALSTTNNQLLEMLESDRQAITSNLANLENELVEAKLEEAERAKLAEQLAANKSVTDSLKTVTTPVQQQPSTDTPSGGNQFSASQSREAFEQITKDLNISASEKAIWSDIITKESGWNTTIWNSAGSGAYGLGQALPAGKMAPYGADYMTNPYTQLTWMYHYVMDRYGSFAGVNWYSRGWY